MTATNDDNGGYSLAPDPEPPRPPAPRPSVARPDGPALRCPDCRYDIRGLPPGGQCPECGLKLTPGAVRRAQRKIEGTPLMDQPWFVATLLLVGGIVGVGVLAVLIPMLGGRGSDDLITDLVLYGAQLVLSIIVGCVVYFVCGLMWIGFAQNIPITVLQIAGVYATAAAASILIYMLPIPILPWLLSVGVLLGLLTKVLDIEFRDAVLIAIISWVVKTMLTMILVFWLMQVMGV